MRTKIFRSIIATILSVSLILATGSISAFAMEKEENDFDNSPVNVTNVERVDKDTIATTYEFDLSKCEVDEDGYSILPLAAATNYVKSSFTMSGTYHRGGDRVYQGNYLTYELTVIGSDGNTYSQTVTLQLWDYNHAYALHENTVTANGGTTKVRNIPITNNRTYYFKYYSSGAHSLKISMVIYTSY